MKRLGELLLERGAIAVSELHTALEACHRTGGRLGTHLLHYGFVDESALLEALSEQFGVPAVTGGDLTSAPQMVRALLPPGMQRRLLVVPYKKKGGRLLVAMVNPADAAAVEEMSTFTRLEIQPQIATEAAVTTALEGLTTVGADEEEPARPPLQVRDPVQWDQLWEPARVRPADVRTVLAADEPFGNDVQLASFPQLIPLLDVSGFAGDDTLDESGLVRRLQQVRHRDEIGEALLSYAAAHLPRAALFAVHKDRILGWMGRGEGVVTDDLQSVAIPLDQPSLLVNLLQSGTYYLGSVPPGDANQALAESLGQPSPHEFVVLPVRIKDRAVAFLVGDSPETGVAVVPVHDLVVAANRAGIAFEILILRNKIRQ